MSDPQDPAALAPCPFCGGEAMLYGSHHPEWKLCRVACSECGARGCSYNSRADAAAAWNRRATDPAVLALTEERDALRRTLSSARASIRLVLNRDKISEWTAGALREAETEIDAALRGKETK